MQALMALDGALKWVSVVQCFLGITTCVAGLPLNALNTLRTLALPRPALMLLNSDHYPHLSVIWHCPPSPIHFCVIRFYRACKIFRKHVSCKYLALPSFTLQVKVPRGAVLQRAGAPMQGLLIIRDGILGLYAQPSRLVMGGGDSAFSYIKGRVSAQTLIINMNPEIPGTEHIRRSCLRLALKLLW